MDGGSDRQIALTFVSKGLKPRFNALAHPLIYYSFVWSNFASFYDNSNNTDKTWL